MSAIIEILPTEKITESARNPRREVGDVAELAASVKRYGILEPLIVVPANGGYELVAGARRLAAAKAAGLQEVPAIVRTDLDERGRLEVMVVENLQRTDLTPVEEAWGYQQLLELDPGLSQRDVAALVGRNQSHVSRRLALLELPPAVQKQVDAGGITVPDALELTKLVGMPKRLERVLHRPSWQDVKTAVAREFEDHRRAERRGKRIQGLKAKGLKVLANPPGYAYGGMSQDKPVRLGIGAPIALQHIDRKAHEKEPCHAVAVDGAGEVVPCCTKPLTHVKGATERGASVTKLRTQPPKETPAQVRAREHGEALEAGTAARVDLVRRILGRKVDRAKTFPLVAAAFVTGTGDPWENQPTACRFLSIGNAGTDGRWDPPAGGVAKFAEQGEEDAVRAAVALALAAGEDGLGDRWAAREMVGPYLRFLERYGHELTEAEQLELKGKAPR